MARVTFQAPSGRKERSSDDPRPPIEISDGGIAWAVGAAPTTEQAWLALTGPTTAEQKELAVRALAARERLDAATAATVKGLSLLPGLRGAPVPEPWVDRFCELATEEMEALWAWDEVAHAMAGTPGWVRTAEGYRATNEQADRLGRVLTRAMQGYGSANIEREHVADLLDELDAAAGFGTIDEVRQVCRRLVEASVRARYRAPSLVQPTMQLGHLARRDT